MCPVPGSQSFLPMLVMELLKTNLHDYLLDGSQRPSSSITVAILLGISKGLAYLHAKAVLHRDLTAKNILLTSDTVAKISDFGNSKIIESDVISQLDSMTPIPGTRYYMPPEAETGSYSFSLDIFSFGHLALFTITRKYLRSLPAPKFYEGGECKGCSEVDRRFMSFDIIKKQLGEDHILTSLITKCLDDDAKNRPTAEELITTCKLNSSQLWIDPDDPYTVRLYDDDIN
jgi:serine/threonine protein kinase